MPERTDQDYLLNEQYKDASNLNARIALHQRFSTNTANWYQWLFDHFNIPAGAHILELGSGSALLWKNNLERIPADWQIRLSDLSPGMQSEASKNVGDATAFTFEVVDAQAIPFDAETFDTVIANHMLYHVPDQGRALAEIRRVLKPDGRFYAATNGENHLHEIDEFLMKVVPATADKYAPSNFTLENGSELLEHYFSHVEFYRFESDLRITEVEPLIDYMRSTRVGALLVDDKLDELRTLLRQEMAQHEAIFVTKFTGLFEASGKR